MNMQLSEKMNTSNASPLLHIVLLIWNQIPLLLMMDVMLGLSLIPAGVVWVVGFPLFAPVVAALTLGPIWTAVSAVANRLVRDESVSWRDFICAISQYWRTAIAVSLVPAAIATIFLATWLMLRAIPSTSWLYVPLFVDGCVGTFIFLASLSAFALVTSRPLHGWRLWKVSLALTILQPAKMLGTLALFVLLGLLLVALNSALLLQLLFAPFAVCLSLLIRQACEGLEKKAPAA